MRESRFFQNCGTFNTNQNKKYHNFERNENRATVFLKWTDFRDHVEKQNIISYEPANVHIHNLIFWSMKKKTWAFNGQHIKTFNSGLSKYA